MDTDMDTDATAELKPQQIPRLQNEEETIRTPLPNASVDLDEFASNLKSKMTVDDFCKCKLLSRPWFGKKRIKNITNVEQLVNALKAKFQDNNRVFYILLELMTTIQRYDLLRIGNWCKHNVHICIKNEIIPDWIKWYEAIESLNPSDKAAVVDKLGDLLIAENDDATQQMLLDSLDDLFDKNVVMEVERKLLKANPPYPMDTSPCGICVIINNKTFLRPDKFPDRLGTEVDRDNLKDLWKEFDFKVEIYEDQTAAQMKGILFHLSQTDHSRFSCVVVCVLTHGEEDVILGVDGCKIHIGKEIIPLFYSNKNVSLTGKPKLFFIQACQGGTKMSAVREAVESDARMFEEASVEEEVQSDAPSTHPNRADDFIFMATAEGFAAYRSKVEGSWFVSTLVRCLRLLGDESDLLEVTRTVKDKVAKAETSMEGKVCKQMPMVKSTLRKTLKFRQKQPARK